MRRVFFVMLAMLAAMSLVAETAILKDIKGKVEVKQLGGDWKAATDGMTIDILATISTGFNSSAVLMIADNKVAVAPLTRLTVDKIVAQAGTLKTSLNLRVGTVSASVKSSTGMAQEFKVTSPYSTASVRGTQFTFNGLALTVREGTVAFIPGRPVRDIVVPSSWNQPHDQGGGQGQGQGSGQGQDQNGGQGGGQGQGATQGSGDASSGQAPAGAGAGAPSSGLGGGASFMTALKNEFGGDSFSFVDSRGDPIPPPNANQGVGGASSAPQPQAAPPQPPQTPVYVHAGLSSVIVVDYSKPGGAAAPTKPGAPGQGPVGPGAGMLMPPTPPAPPPASTGGVTIHWN